MMIDSLAAMPPPPIGDSRAERKRGWEDSRPVEKSGESYDSALDMTREDVFKGAGVAFRLDEEDVVTEIYNAKGTLIRRIPPGYVPLDDPRSLNLKV
ncbi:MAG: hypothetical protein JW821_08665 [Deltaproteobacteria bacterium]|nr:hypothetical protein [Deltaproteobacteria bacterium]